jgi:ferredoxin
MRFAGGERWLARGLLGVSILDPRRRQKMANVTFSSPRMKHDLTVYAVAGDTHTLLSVAQKNKVPLSFECQNGECGSCAIKVTLLSGKKPMGVMLTDKEKAALKLAGKISPEQIAAAENEDVPPPYRLACQFIVRNEDILVTF